MNGIGKMWRGVRRILSYYARCGFAKSVTRVWDEIRWQIFINSPIGLLRRRECRNFDRLHKIGTNGEIAASNLDLPPDMQVHSSAYGPTPPWVVRDAIRCIEKHAGPDFIREASLIDLGSGKGRIVIVAARFPFKSIIGVELSKALHEIARVNVEAVGLGHTASAQITLICESADTFKYPNGPLVVTLFNPFRGAVLRRVVEQIIAAYDEHEHRLLYVVYINAVHESEFLRTGRFAIVRKNRRSSVYMVR